MWPGCAAIGWAVTFVPTLEAVVRAYVATLRAAPPYAPPPLP